MVTQQKRSPELVDRHVGMRMRMRRLMLGMSQEKLGAKLGVTFQQVQKYEKGINRISASRLQQISDILMVREHFFFEGSSPGVSAGGEAPLPSYFEQFLGSQDGLALASAFMRINDTKLRRSIVELVSSISRA